MKFKAPVKAKDLSSCKSLRGTNPGCCARLLFREVHPCNPDVHTWIRRRSRKTLPVTYHNNNQNSSQTCIRSTTAREHRKLSCVRLIMSEARSFWPETLQLRRYKFSPCPMSIAAGSSCRLPHVWSWPAHRPMPAKDIRVTSTINARAM